jgi:hypothetical protein
MMTNKNLEYEVEAIIEYRGTSAKTLQHKVKWLGYLESDWQPLTNLNCGCREILQQYSRNTGLLVYNQTFDWLMNGICICYGCFKCRKCALSVCGSITFFSTLCFGLVLIIFGVEVFVGASAVNLR